MSCFCKKVNCPCDKFVHPRDLKIAAGLDTIPRQIATFSEFRNAMLAAIRTKNSLSNWRARGKDDLGIMLLEMWAYVCDVLAAYDEIIAHEVYLRTARRRPSLRKLVNLLGYLPRPAVASSVRLAILAEGRKVLSLPAGMAFRSGAFDGAPPQVFELDSKTIVHPFTNSWTVKPQYSRRLESENPLKLLIKDGSSKFSPGDVVLVRISIAESETPQIYVRTIKSCEVKDDQKYGILEFNEVWPDSTIERKIDSIQLLTPTQVASLWTLTQDNEAVETFGNKTLLLDGIYKQIKPNTYILVSKGEEFRWFEIISANDVLVTLVEETSTTPAVRIPATKLTLDTYLNEIDLNEINLNEMSTNIISLNETSKASRSTKCPANKLEVWSEVNIDRATITIHFGFAKNGIVADIPKEKLESNDSIELVGPFEIPEESSLPDQFLFEDNNHLGVDTNGNINFTTGHLTSNVELVDLSYPIQVFGNIVTANRGETVEGEILGSGDASISNQSFVLKKKPLTYLPAPRADNEIGVKNTLSVYVNRIQWKEVSSFYNSKEEDQVYIVRQDDKGDSRIIFGDGKHGARIPTGTDNVIAYYRFGAGAASPPAGSITQIATPVKGVKSIRNPVAAGGGDDKESSSNLRKYAPKSALILGRAVSMQDMEAVAASVPGVRAVHAEWRWHESKQRPVVQIWYIGDTGIEAIISEKVRSVSDPSTPISVDAAVGVEVELSIEVEIDPNYLEEDVLVQVKEMLLGQNVGLLLPECIGIGQPLYRSRIAEIVYSVEGIVAIHKMTWNSAAFNNFALRPEPGTYFDLEKGTLLLNVKEETGG